MTIVPRTFSAAFLRRPAGSHWGTQPVQAPAHTEVAAAGGSAGITAAPWEGLYLEVEESQDSAAASALPADSGLERFLASLMYGD